ncbi:ATP-binding cassette domain-containing protein [Pseudoduganella sp. FT25W]|jgi:lipopolysaccharide transport system ATP-binding protein|uniref:ATP-binding cassette domain-containing protein n=1 Tax=Duganella alba TaxID=2666081 RepID=A0A6L5QRX8_9BURK|nr:ABC transporter ATP-binding protein [Duganella alba]MRX11581.1 ATP-binding cassette domain-containing protein [Duganella alba]MRX20038.1 ATP-binding cassette domain-containing protein [Duganella alba]
MGSIHVAGLGKAYKQYPTRGARLAEWLLPFRGPRHKLKWVLQDISFDVAPGEAVGLIGINGAGKSTLLKLITGTTQPTTGGVTIHGRVAALLELGMGFHPDFTGRQNVLMAGQLFGLTVPEIQELMPQIEAFADIGDYIDQPVRVYSSGMQMRLAFSVATARRPDVLIVDEALSVGDAYFQHKSFERIRQFRREGTTLLLVSHDKQAVQTVCDRAILLDGGRLARQGPPEEIMDYYNALLAERDNARVRVEDSGGKAQTVSGTGEATVADIVLLDADGAVVEVVDVGVPVTLQVTVAARAAIPRMVLGYMIKDRLGNVMYGTNTHLKELPQEAVTAGETLVYRFAFPMNLGAGSYSVATAIVSTDTHLVNNYEWRDLALVFTVVNMRRPHFEGSAWLDPAISISRT